MPLSKETLLEKIRAAETLYNRLVFVVADSGSGKTRLLRQISEELRSPLVNVSFELSRRLLDLTEPQRTLRLPRLLHEIVDEGGSSETTVRASPFSFKDEASAIQWLKQQLTKRPQTFQDIHPQFLKGIGG